MKAATHLPLHTCKVYSHIKMATTLILYQEDFELGWISEVSCVVLSLLPLASFAASLGIRILVWSMKQSCETNIDGKTFCR